MAWPLVVVAGLLETGFALVLAGIVGLQLSGGAHCRRNHHTPTQGDRPMPL